MFTVSLDFKISKNQKIFLLFLQLLLFASSSFWAQRHECNWNIFFFIFLCFWQIKVWSAVIGAVGFFVAVELRQLLRDVDEVCGRLTFCLFCIQLWWSDTVCSNELKSSSEVTSNRFGVLDLVGLKGSQTFNEPNIILTSGFGVAYLRFDHEWSGTSCLFSQLSGPFIPIIINLHNKDGLCTVYDWLCTTGQENWLCRASIRWILQPGLISLQWNWNVFCYLF